LAKKEKPYRPLGHPHDRPNEVKVAAAMVAGMAEVMVAVAATAAASRHSSRSDRL
jgi:hypothetical protein